jgi:hypothetical protein
MAVGCIACQDVSTAEKSKESVPAIEKNTLRDIRAGGVGTRFVLKDLKPAEFSAVGGQYTVSQLAAGTFVFTREYADDAVVLDGVGGRVKAALEVGEGFVRRSMVGGDTPAECPFADGAVWRCKGKVSCEGHTFIGEAESPNQMSFVLLRGVGLVYLRGIGQVLIGNEAVVKLGHQSPVQGAPTPKASQEQTGASDRVARDAPAQETRNPVFAAEFERLRRGDELQFSLESLNILAKANLAKYRLLVELQRSMGATTMDLMGNPFFKDTEDEYRRFLKDLERARDQAGLNVQLTLYRNLARWRLSELEEGAPERERRRAEFDVKLAAAKTSAALRELIWQHEGQPYVVRAKEKLEDLLIENARSNPAGAKSVLPPVEVAEGKKAVRVTFRGVAGNPHAFVMTEYPNDGPLALGFGGQSQDVPGDGSVHRYRGEVAIPVGSSIYKINGDEKDPVAFLLLRGRGYVYLHGKGTVTLPNGQVLRLEETQSPVEPAARIGAKPSAAAPAAAGKAARYPAKKAKK